MAQDDGPRDVADRIARTWAADRSLQLDRERLAYLSGIHAFLELNPDPVLTEEQLRDIFGLLNDIVQGETGAVAQRATYAIDALCAQHLLVRSDFGGVSTAGEFSLSPLGKTLAEWFGAQEGLDREGLEVMLTRIRGDLAGVRQAALLGGDETHWRARVVSPLKLTVAGLVEMIDRRQRGMDVQQQEIREQIGQLLEAQWFEAIARCETLLQNTGVTLQELNHTLMSETEGVANLLNEIFEAADDADQDAALDAVSYVRTQIERVAAWGDSRFQSWSAYYQNVHEFIRTIVRVDRDRALRARLRDGLKSYTELPWHLRCAAQTPYRHLREPESGLDTKAVVRRRTERDDRLVDALAETDPLERVFAALHAQMNQTGRLDLWDLLHERLPSHSDEELFLMAGALVRWMLAQGEPLPPQGWQWIPLGRRLEVQNLVVERTAREAQRDG